MILRYLDAMRGAEAIVWRIAARARAARRRRRASASLAFHLHRRRAAAMAFSQIGARAARAASARGSSDLPGVLRVLALAALAVALARPETYRTIEPRDRLDRHHDRRRHVEVDGGDRHAARPPRRRAARDPAVPAPHQATTAIGLVDLRPAGDAAVPADARHQGARADRRATSRSATCPSSAPRSATALALSQLRDELRPARERRRARS